MSAPTLSIRTSVYRRDGWRCVACGSLSLTFQHRRAVGMGGSKVKPTPEDGLALCGGCNDRCERDLQTVALLHGWKVRRWATPTDIPVYYPRERAWYRLDGTQRVFLVPSIALDMMLDVYGDEYLTWST